MTDWMQRASCASVGGDLWFPPLGSPGTIAKAICKTCPVKRQCLELAVENGETEGIWAGMSGHRLRDYVRAQRRAA